MTDVIIMIFSNAFATPYFLVQPVVKKGARRADFIYYLIGYFSDKQDGLHLHLDAAETGALSCY